MPYVRKRRSSYRKSRTSRKRVSRVRRVSFKKRRTTKTIAKLSRRISSNAMKLVGPPQQMLLKQPAFFVSAHQTVSWMNENIQPGQAGLYATNTTYPHAISVPTVWSSITTQLFPPIGTTNNIHSSWADTIGFRVNARYRIAYQKFQLSVLATNSCCYLDVMIIKARSALRNSTTTGLQWPSCISGMVNLSPVPVIGASEGIQNTLDSRFWRVLMRKRIFLNTYAANATDGHGAGRGPFFHHMRWTLRQNKMVTCRIDPLLTTSGPEQSRSYLDLPLSQQTYTVVTCGGLSDTSNFRNVSCSLSQEVHYRDSFAERPQATTASEYHQG